MEKKRKLPARASARVESANKKRNITPRERSETPAPPPPVVKEPTPPPPLPKSIQPGKPLPTVEDAQPDDLSSKEYQSISESGVLVESLSRSRHKWISDGLFEKFWTKPFKRKGVMNEDPNNPPKDSMTKVGTVTITIEPHVIEATMFAVKESRLRPQEPQQQTQARPILQYGPPNGSMPPPPTPKPGTPTLDTATASPKPAVSPLPSDIPPQSSSSLPRPRKQSPAAPIETAKTQVPTNATNAAPTPSPTPTPTPSLTSQPVVQPPAASGATPRPPPPPQPSPHLSSVQNAPPVPSARSPLSRPTSVGSTPAAARPPVSASSGQQPPAARPPVTTPSSGASTKPAPNDPVIALLAQKASGDATLRDLMRRVAIGQAKDGELAHFQKIIDQLSADYRRSGGQQGPSADRLLVDGRTVKYFADEVRAILDIVLASNPHQKSSDLRPPPRSDPLVVLLVKTALENQRVKDIITRIADGCPGFTDSTDLKETLDRLHRDAKTVPQGLSVSSNPTANGLSNGQPKVAPMLQAPQASQPPPAPPPPPSQQKQQQQQQQQQQPQQQNSLLRSKGPPPAPKPDLAAVVFDFGNGDRYLFPRFSIVEHTASPTGQEVVASFLIVRKGSMSEYGGDPKLDYYQPVTIRIFTPTGRHLENLARVVAPPEEVRRYMDDVMDNMTRAEYVLLAMRLPRNAPKQGDKDDGSLEDAKTSSSASQVESEVEPSVDAKPAVLWTTSAIGPSRLDSIPLLTSEEESEMKYQRLIQSVTAKEDL